MKGPNAFILGAAFLAGLAGCAHPNERLGARQAQSDVAMGVKMESLGDLDKAEALYQSAARDPETRQLALTNLGNVSAARNDLARAESFYRQALALEETPQALNNLGWMYVLHGTRLAEAADLAARGAELARRPDLLAACAHTAGLAHALGGDVEKGVPWLVRAAEASRGGDGRFDADIAFDLARHLMLCRRFAEAVEVLDSAGAQELPAGHRLVLLRHAAARRIGEETRAGATAAGRVDE